MTYDTPDKPNCYVCVHRGTVPGSVHSSCQHPLTADVHETDLAKLVREMGRRSGIAGIQSPAAKALEIVGADQGVRSGWFIWPVNFDPTWLEHCTGFKPAGSR